MHLGQLGQQAVLKSEKSFSQISFVDSEITMADEWFAKIRGIPVRTIQQYEQKQKDINKARAEYEIALSRALYCDPGLLLENELQ